MLSSRVSWFLPLVPGWPWLFRAELWLVPLVLLSPTQGPASLCCVDWCGLGAGYLLCLGVLAVVLMTKKDFAWK